MYPPYVIPRGDFYGDIRYLLPSYPKPEEPGRNDKPRIPAADKHPACEALDRFTEAPGPLDLDVSGLGFRARV